MNQNLCKSLKHQKKLNETQKKKIQTGKCIFYQISKNYMKLRKNIKRVNEGKKENQFEHQMMIRITVSSLEYIHEKCLSEKKIKKALNQSESQT